MPMSTLAKNGIQSLVNSRVFSDKFNAVLQNSATFARSRYNIEDTPITLYCKKDGNQQQQHISAIGCSLRKCIQAKTLFKGKQIHDYIAKIGLSQNGSLANLLIQMYGRCGAIQDARAVFEHMHQQNSISWNIMLSVYVKTGELEEALKFFQNMPERNVVSWTTMLAAFANHGHLEDALSLFQQMPKKDVMSWNTMIMAYVRQGMLKEAVQLFEQMPFKDTVSWNTLISAYCQNGHIQKGYRLFQAMPERSVISWTILVSAYAQEGNLDMALGLFQQMPWRDIVSWNTMITAYIQHGHLKEALQLFQGMPERDICSWNTIISAYSQHGKLEEAIKLFLQMPQRNMVSWNAMIAAYTESGCLEEACSVFHQMPLHDVVSWNTVLCAYAQRGNVKEIVNLFQQMLKEGFKPSEVTFVNILDGFAKYSTLAEGKLMHTCVAYHGFDSDVICATALVNMYAKCGSLANACQVFNKIPQRNIISWNTLLAAYAEYGCGKAAVNILHSMPLEGIESNQVTYLNVFSACNHSGLVDEAYHCFFSMTSDHHCSPTLDHYNCIVDILGRAKKLDEAVVLISNIPFQPNLASWAMLLLSIK